jgi:amino acid permease
MSVQSSGVVLGTVMFLLGAVLNAYTSILMVDVNKHEHGATKTTFENIAYKLFGPATEQVLRCSLLVLLFGFVCGNLVVLAPVRRRTGLQHLQACTSSFRETAPS